jgi:uncharacterized protein (DUF2267 family)
MMDAAELHARVAARLPETVDVSAEELMHHVLAALAERLTPDEAAELGAELPDELGDILAGSHGDGQLDRDELLEEIAARLDIDDDDAEAGTIAVLTVIREYLEPMVAIEQVLESLPPDLAQLMTPS